MVATSAKTFAISMEELQRLSLISKITTEIRNHWGVEDKTLAEFVIDLGQSSSSLEEFKEKLAENGAESEDNSPAILSPRRVIRVLRFRKAGR